MHRRLWSDVIQVDGTRRNELGRQKLIIFRDEPRSGCLAVKCAGNSGFYSILSLIIGIGINERIPFVIRS